MTKKMIKLTLNSIGLVAAVATFFAGFAFKNVGLGITGVLTTVPLAIALKDSIKNYNA